MRKSVSRALVAAVGGALMGIATPAWTFEDEPLSATVHSSEALDVSYEAAASWSDDESGVAGRPGPAMEDEFEGSAAIASPPLSSELSGEASGSVATEDHASEF